MATWAAGSTGCRRPRSCRYSTLSMTPPKETAMHQHLIPNQTVAAAFDTVTAADRAIRRLRLAGFTEDQLAVVCPGKFKEDCLCATLDSETASAGAAEVMAK